jgi:hypothetical protein
MPIVDSVVTTTFNTQQSDLIQQDKINVFNDTSYTKSSNAVKLLPAISNNNNKIKLYTEINANFVVGDRIFIMFDENIPNTQSDAIILDNYLEFSGCTDYIYLKQMQGYKVIEINDSNNEITIDRYFDSRIVNKRIYNHYISKIYARNLIITGGELDGIAIKNSILNNTGDTSIDIKLTQSIILSGNSYYVNLKNKYDKNYITTNSMLNTGVTTSTFQPYSYKSTDISNQDPTPVSSHYTNNNKGYGYNYNKNMFLQQCQIDNGYYENCTIVDGTINGGYFLNCQINNVEINSGDFSGSTINANCLWLNGNWNGDSSNFLPTIWYNGVWNSGDFIGKEWRNGVFNNGNISYSNWITGIFQGTNSKMDNCVWYDGTFSNGEIKYSTWFKGTLNSGNMTNCTWIDGTVNGGLLTNINWTGGTFNNGTITKSTWLDGVFNGGTFSNSIWTKGTFNGGSFNTSNNVVFTLAGSATISYSNQNNGWITGTFNGGDFINSVWSGGTFNGGNFSNGSLWFNGTYVYGYFNDSYWINGYFENGNVNNSYFHNVDWRSGTWNSGIIGFQYYTDLAIVHWSGGTFNNGIFGDGTGTTSRMAYIYWYGGDFYNGTFYSYSASIYPPCTAGYGGFYDGIWHNGNFNGIFWGGTWITGIFGGCNQTGSLTNKTVKTNFIKNNLMKKTFGEGPITAQQKSKFLQ